jgi:hypothetical protein
VPVSDLAFVPSLNGEEIVLDLCGLIAEKLRSDCNLRPIDGYSGGYRASVKIHLEAFGLDSAIVDYTVEADETGLGQDAENPVDLENPDEVIDTELEVPVEADLSLVRERSAQPTPDFEMKPVAEITAEGPVGKTQPRKYTRRLKALAAAQGGAAGPMEE